MSQYKYSGSQSGGRPYSSVLRGAPGDANWGNSDMNFNVVIVLTNICTWMPWSREVQNVLEGWDQLHSEMHIKNVIEQEWRYTWGQPSRELSYALGGRDQVRLEIHWEARLKWTQRCTWEQWSSVVWEVVGGHDQSRMAEYWEVVHRKAVDWEGGTIGGETLFIG